MTDRRMGLATASIIKIQTLGKCTCTRCVFINLELRQGIGYQGAAEKDMELFTFIYFTEQNSEGVCGSRLQLLEPCPY